MLSEFSLGPVLPNTVYRLVTNSVTTLLVTVSWNTNTLDLTVINKDGTRGRNYDIKNPHLAEMCLNSNWVKKPVPGLVLDEQHRLYIGWSEVY